MSAAGGLYYYRVLASTAERKSEVLVGYYNSRKLANDVGEFVRNHFSGKVGGAIYVNVQHFSMLSKDRAIVVQTELSDGEKARLIQLNFKAVVWQKAP